MKRMRTPIVAAFAVMAAASGAEAANTPEILLSKGNKVPACVTPEHLMTFMEGRNKALPAKFREIAADYKRHGEALHIRWDYAFYQMLVETNYLKFVAGPGKRGDVSPGQNNFAGLGATGHRVPGESFPDVDTGVLAHLQHVRLYSGDPVDNPVAERTKLVTDLILPWAQSLKHPVTFTDLTHKWAPSGHSYSDAIEGTADLYRQAFCGGSAGQETASADETAEPVVKTPAKPLAKVVVAMKVPAMPAASDAAGADDAAADNQSPAPMALAGPALKKPARIAAAKIVMPTDSAKAPDVDGDGQPDTADEQMSPVDGTSDSIADLDPARKAIPPIKSPSTKLPVAATVTAPTVDTANEGTDIAAAGDGGDGGAIEVAAPVAKVRAVKVAATSIVTASTADLPALPTKLTAKAPGKTAAKATVAEPADTTSSTTETTTEDAASNTQLASLTVPANPAPLRNCKVFTASYGGGKSLLIQSLEGDHTRFTALTVNETKADAQANAFINVYAKGGQKIGEFGTQNEALTKAFQLCPES